jgi:phosphatidylglycerophosphate synthase
MKRKTVQSNANFWRMARAETAAAAISTGLALWRAYGLLPAVRYMLGFAATMKLQRMFLSSIMKKTGVELASVADVLTLSRGAAGAALVGLVTSGIRDREGLAGKLGWSLILVEATAIDWLDGPLARRLGPTRLGSVMDIEFDSWLTLWSGICAVAWGDAPRLCLLPPILRYLDPLLDMRWGELPRGGGPWWSRVTGTLQMVLFLTALAPFKGRWRKQAIEIATLPVSVGQGVAILVLLGKKIRKGGDYDCSLSRQVMSF